MNKKRRESRRRRRRSQRSPNGGGAQITFHGLHNAALDVIQHGNVALAISADPEYIAQGLHQDDLKRLRGIKRRKRRRRISDRNLYEVTTGRVANERAGEGRCAAS